MGLFGKVEAFFGGGEEERHSHSHSGYQCDELHPEEHSANRFQSFAAPSSGNIKWFVDGCSYFWAVSEALQSKPLPASIEMPRSSAIIINTSLHRGAGEHIHPRLVVEP